MAKFVFVCVIMSLMAKNILGITLEQNIKIVGTILEHGLTCMQQYPLSNEEMASLKGKTIPEGEHIGCFIGCIFRALGVLNEDGNIEYSGLKESTKSIFGTGKDLENLEEYVSSCHPVNNEQVSDGTKGCDRSKLAFKCLTENAEKFGFSFSI